LDPIPNVRNFRSWRLSFKKKVAGASQHPESAFRWITEIEDPVSTMELLGDSSAFPILDANIAAASGSVIHGSLRDR